MGSIARIKRVILFLVDNKLFSHKYKLWLGFSGIISFTILFYTFFMFTYLSESKQGILWINKYGEANIEFVLLLLLLPFVTYTLYWGLKNFKNEKC